MPVYLIADIQIHHRQRYARYTDRVQAIVARHGGRYLVRGGNVISLSGDWRPQRVVVIAFETADQLHACFSSPEYQAIALLRESSTTSRSIVVQGYTPDATILF